MINEDSVPKIIISASGMCEAGRIRHHLKHNLWRPESTILFVGYQSQGTVGAKLLEGAESVRLFGEEIQVLAEISNVDSFSSHADRKALLEWISQADPDVHIFINHGEDTVTEDLAMEAARQTGKPATAPYSGEVWDLISGELVQKAVVVPVIRKQAQDRDDYRGFRTTESTAKAAGTYEELRRAGDDLMELIRNSQGGANKDIRALTEEISGLIEKYRG